MQTKGLINTVIAGFEGLAIAVKSRIIAQLRRQAVSAQSERCGAHIGLDPPVNVIGDLDCKTQSDGSRFARQNRKDAGFVAVIIGALGNARVNGTRDLVRIGFTGAFFFRQHAINKLALNIEGVVIDDGALGHRQHKLDFGLFVRVAIENFRFQCDLVGSRHLVDINIKPFQADGEVIRSF